MENMTLPCIADTMKFPTGDNVCSISGCQSEGDIIPESSRICNGDGDTCAATPKKRRSHTSMMRRSLSESSSASYDSAIIGEAHGLITDMLADTTLPPHVVSGLRAVSNLLKPSDCHSSIHKTRVSPLVSLTESTSYGSDSEESPYTGERPSSLPKRLRRSLPPSLLRRMSTSTWTTTTSATGMPTLELEPCRVRSSSFRHSRDATPGSSPVESRSNSPSPSSPTVILTIPKSRSFSLAATQPTPSSHLKKLSRKSVTPLLNTDCMAFSHSKAEKVSPLVIGEQDSADERLKVSAVNKEHLRKTVTSDYESCNESPSSSDHSDNILNDEITGSPPKKLIGGRTDISTQVARVTKARDFLPISDHTSYICSEDIIPSQHVSPPALVRPRPHFPHKRDYRVREEDDESHEAAADDEDDGDDEDGDTDIRQSVKPSTDSSSKDLASVVIYETTDSDVAKVTEDKLLFDIAELDNFPLLSIECLNEWDYPIFEVAHQDPCFVLSKIAYRLFMEVGLFETFRIPVGPFMNYFHALEMGYRSKPYHNRVHATDVLHGVYYLTTQPIPGFTQVISTDVFSRQTSSSDSEGDLSEHSPPPRANSFAADDSYGIMGGNFPALELMALYTAAAMHDYDHPGRTNAFLVATNAPQAVLYNDRSVLENHHAASAWHLFLSNPNYCFLSGLDNGEFKRFRYLVIESILATDLKRHFEILAEFNAKTNDDPTSGVDWTVEADRLLVAQMVIKLADINGPAKTKDLHTRWTTRISEEFYEQGDEESRLGMPISPYMDRRNPQLSKLQETFINHLVAPLCNALVTGGLLPGTWVDEDSDAEDSDPEKGDSACKDTEDENETDTENGSPVVKVNKHRRVNCLLTKNMKDNHTMWVAKIEEEEQQKALSEKLESIQQDTPSIDKKAEMEPIKEESESPSSMSPTLRQFDKSLPPQQTVSHSKTGDKSLPPQQTVSHSKTGDKCLTSPRTGSTDNIVKGTPEAGSNGSRDNT